MNLEKVKQKLTEKFTSGNDIPVTQATIKLEEWEVIKKALDDHGKVLIWKRGKGFVEKEETNK